MKKLILRIINAISTSFEKYFPYNNEINSYSHIYRKYNYTDFKDDNYYENAWKKDSDAIKSDWQKVIKW